MVLKGQKGRRGQKKQSRQKKYNKTKKHAGPMSMDVDSVLKIPQFLKMFKNPNLHMIFTIVVSPNCGYCVKRKKEFEELKNSATPAVNIVTLDRSLLEKALPGRTVNSDGVPSAILISKTGKPQTFTKADGSVTNALPTNDSESFKEMIKSLNSSSVQKSKSNMSTMPTMSNMVPNMATKPLMPNMATLPNMVTKPTMATIPNSLNLYRSKESSDSTVLSNIKYTPSPVGASSIDDILDKDGRPSPLILTPQRGVLNISGYGTPMPKTVSMRNTLPISLSKSRSVTAPNILEDLISVSKKSNNNPLNNNGTNINNMNMNNEEVEENSKDTLLGGGLFKELEQMYNKSKQKFGKTMRNVKRKIRKTLKK